MNEPSILNPTSLNATPPVVDSGERSVLETNAPVGNVNRRGSLSLRRMAARRIGTLGLPKLACSLVSLLVWLGALPALAQTTSVDLSVRQRISNQKPVIGDVISYTLAVSNAAESATATNVRVQNSLPTGGVAYVSGSASVLRGTGTYAPGTGVFSVNTLAPGDSAVLVLQATVLGQGVYFNTTEVIGADQADADSPVNNGVLTEDDYAAICFSVPILFYQGDEYTVTIPSGYDQIIWYRNDVPISTSAVSTSLAEVNANGSLTFKSTGVYRFVTVRDGCPVTNCCDIEVIQGPFGSLGNFVFLDTNRNGLQDDGPTGIDGVRVYLYDQTGTTRLDSAVTTGGGQYLFDSLTDGQYRVQFVAPNTNLSFTQPDVTAPADSLDSDAGTNGFTRIYTIDTSRPAADLARNNPNVDAGFIQQLASLGDRVFVDANRDGQQGPPAQEPGLAGVVVSLINTTNGSTVATDTTDVNGLYSFTGLTPGVPYSVNFATPAGYQSTTANLGNDATDSDVLADGSTAPVTLTASEANTSVDAGFFVPGASLGDRVFVDANRDGQQGPPAQEPGLPGVIVSLINTTNGSLVATETTDANGSYMFMGLTPGVPYSLSFTAPVGYSATVANAGDDATDSDLLASGVTGPITLTAGENNTSVDAGFFVPSATLGGNVFVDANRDGQQGPLAQEPGLPGVIVSLINTTNGTLVASVTTDANGLYSFTGLTPGTPYSVSFTSPAGYSATVANIGNDASDSDPVGGITAPVTLTAGETNTSVDAGFFVPSATLGDRVFVDANRDGQQGPIGQEPGLQGVVVSLINTTNGSLVATETTDAGGLYSFTGLTPGTPYSLSFTVPTGYSATVANQGNDATDSDLLSTGVTGPITLTAGENNTSADAGFFVPSASLGDRVFVDANRDGQQGPPAQEPGLPGVIVSLINTTNGTLVASDTTDANGIYMFMGLTPGTPYSVSFTSPAGYSATVANIGNDAGDSDPVGGITAPVTLTAGENNMMIDAGFFVPSATLGGNVFVDANRDGQQGPIGQEPALPGVIVTIINTTNGSIVASVTTDANGVYSFTGLTPGVPYSVSFTSPAGYSATVANVGDDATDSDPVGGVTAPVTLTAGENNTSVDAGFFVPSATLGDRVFVDANRDGQQGPPAQEPGLPGVVVSLINTTNGTLVASVTTDANGLYSFTGLTPGTPYSLSFTVPTGYSATVANVGDDATDSDLLGTGVTGPITLTAGENNTAADAGFFLIPASLGNLVFLDNNANGIQEPGLGETGVAGIRVTLYQNTTATAVASTTTNASGLYSFTGLTPGSGYFVVFDTTGLSALGFALTPADQGGNDVTDSDAGANGQTTQTYSLSSGEANTTVDAGIRPSRFDLALRKTTASTVALAGQQVTYTITVFNQGNVNAFNVEVTDYIPAGMSLVTGGIWTPSGTAVTTTVASLSAGASIDIPLVLTVNAVPAGTTLVNAAEVSNADTDSDPTNASLADIDSRLDNDPTNNGTPEDDIITEDGNAGNDIDNSDIAVIVVTQTPIFDLALTKRLSPTQVQPILPGSQVTYQVQVFNQGTVAAQRIQLTDYLPAGLVLADANWTLTNGVATRTLAGTLAAGQDTTVSLVMTVSPDFAGDSLTNAAEISLADDDNNATNGSPIDIDSDFDGNPANDGTAKDDVITENRKLDPTADEDDSDVAPTRIAQPASLGDLVFLDINANGVQDGGAETGIASVTVTLYQNSTAMGGTPVLVASTVTNASGLYSFTGLTPGVPYSLSFTAPAAYSVTVANVGDDATDSDVLAGGVTAPVTLTSGENNTTLDAGFFAPGSSFSLIVAITPAVCDPTTNGYVATGTATLVNAPVGTLTITDNGVVTATIAVTAGQTSASFSLTGVSGTAPLTHTVTAGLASLTSSATYATPASCTVCPTITLAPALANGQANTPYSQTLTASGGVGPYSFAVINGGLPLGLSLDVTTGVISGTPTSATAVSFTVAVTDSRACSATAAYTVSPIPAFLLLIVADPTVCNPVSNVYSTTGVVTLVSAPAGTLTITDNGVVAVTVSVTAGQTSVPFNLSGISGTAPTEHTLVASLASLTATATYDVPLSCTVCAQIALTPSGLIDGLVGAAYSQTLTASGGTAPYTYVVVGSLPVGLSFNGATGVLSGTPTSATVVSFSVLVSDSRSCTTTAAYSLTVGLTPDIAVVVSEAVCDTVTNGYVATGTVSLVGAPVGTLTITDNGVITATIAVTAGQTSASFNLTGVSGSTPATHTVVATLATLTASTTYATPASCTVCAQIALTPSSLIDGLVGAAYSQTLTATGGTAPYSYVVSGALPVGLSFNLTTGVLSGTPTSATVASFTVLVTDARSCTTTAAYSLTVGLTPDIALTIVDPAVCDPTTNGYVATAVVSLVGAPAGILTITDNGVVTATIAVTAGQTSASFSVTGISGSSPATHTVVATLATLTASTTYATPASCTVCPIIAVGPATLIDGLVGAAYSQTLTASGGIAPYSYVVVGSLPVGLSFNGATGVLSGTPTSATTTSFAVIVTDSRSCTGIASYNLTVGLTPDIAVVVSEAVCDTATNGYVATGTVSLVGVPAGTLTITDNGVVTATLAVTAGQTSAGFSLTGVSGSLPATHTVVATLATLTASTTYATPASCTVCAQIAVGPATLIDGLVGAAYSQTLTASGGTAPYSYVVSGSLPTGLSFNVTTGVISGTPTSTTVASFTVLVTDSRSCTATAAYSLTVGLTPDIAVVVGEAVCDPTTNGYSATGTVSLVGASAGTLTITDNGVVTATIAVTAGQTSASFSLTGISGTAPLTHTVTAGLGTLTASTTYATPASCTVCPLIAVGPTTLIDGLVGSAYSQTLTATGGTAPYTYVVVGSLPAGLSFNATTGVLSGTPILATSTSFAVRVTDARSCTATASYTVTVGLTPDIAVVVSQAVCNSLTNGYVATGTVSLVGTPAGVLTITDNGVVTATIAVTAGQTSASFSVTGISSLPATHTIVASLATLTASTTYATPASCTVCETIAVGPAGLIDGLVGAAYSQTLTASGGTAPYTYAVVGSLPAGLSFNGSTGVLSGTPTSATVVSFTVLVTDARSCTTTAAYSLTVGLTPDIAISVTDPAVCDPTTNIYSAMGVVSLVGAPAGTLTITDNGVVALTVSVTAGQTSVPFNLSGISGSLPPIHTIVATLATLTASTTYATPASCTTCPTIAVGPAGLIDGLVGAAYSQTLTASGGTAPYSYVVVGSLPTGLSFNGATGVLSGTPTSATVASFTVLVTDARACTATAAYSLTVGLTPDIAVVVSEAVCNSITNGYVATGTVSLVGAPAGTLTITDNGVVTASIAVTAGQTSASFSVTGISGSSPATHTVVATLATLTASTTYATPASCTVCPTIALAPVSVATGQVGSAYSQTLTASGGAAPYTYAVVGNLPTGLSFDGSTGVLSGTPTSAGTTAFAVLVTDSRSCTGVASYSLTVQLTCPTDFSVVTSADAIICNGETISLTASTGVSGASIRWFLTATDGTAFATTTAGASLTVNPTATTVYYAEAFTADGCVSTRRPITVTVTTVPTPIFAGNLRNTCPATTADLTTVRITNQTGGLTYEWYTSLERSAATRVTNLTAVGAGQYYLFARSGRCYGSPAVLTVEIVNCNCQTVAGVSVGSSLTTCSGQAVPLQAVLSGAATSLTWSSNGTGLFSSPSGLTTTYTPSAADSSAGRVILTATTNDPDGVGGVCSTGTSSLVLTINPRPVPMGVACDDTLICLGSSTKLIGLMPGIRYNWYDSDGRLIGTTQGGGKLTVTPTRAGAVVYYAEAVSAQGCVSATRASITITVGTCQADLAVLKQVVTPAPYQVGQKITYSITVSNNGPITATDVNVSDLLPANLTYVSSTPTGQYAAGTGNWTVGTLTTGSNRNLLMEVTINAGGSITNTAVVTGTNNDLNRTGNDTSSVTIQATGAPVNCTVQAPFITCALTSLCAGGETTLNATGCTGGTVRWSTGQTGATITVRPTLTTTYSASCVAANCVSGASNAITVTVNNPQTPTLTANADRVCPGGDVILTAAGCDGGTYQWVGRTETTASITVNPTSRTTYTVQCRMGGCVSGAATKTIDINTTLPTPTIVCSTSVACPGEDVTLTVVGCTGTPVWSSTSATTSSIIVRPTAGNNSYTVRCQSGSCSSLESPAYVINLVTPAIPTITASTNTVCANGSVTLTATGCDGLVKWSNGLTGATVTVKPDASISYSAQCQFRTCLSAPSNAVAITVITPSAPLISASSGTVCSGESVTLTAQGCDGTVRWNVGSQIGASIIIRPAATATYFATCLVGTCESVSSNQVAVAVGTSGTAPSIVASSLSVCSGGVVTLTATGCTGSVLWSDGQTGAVVSVTATPTNREFYAVCQVGAACGSGRSNVVALTVTPMPTPTVVCSTDTICPGEEITLLVENCQGIPTWSNGMTTRSIVVKPGVTTAYTVFCQEGACTSASSAAYTLTVVPVTIPTITASATVVAAGETVTLMAMGCNGTVIWSKNGIDGRNTGASIIVRPEGTETYSAQCQFRSCLSDPSTTIVVNPGNCVADAGTMVPTSATVCAGTSGTGTSGTVTIAARSNGGLVQPTGYTVAYVLTKGSGLVIQQMGTTPQFTVPADAADYTIHTLVYDAQPASRNYVDLSGIVLGTTTAADVIRLVADRKVCADLDMDGAKITVRRVTPPVLTVDQQVVCAGTTVTITAQGCEGGIINWKDGSVGQSITRTVYSDLWMMATCTLDGCTSELSASIDVSLRTPGIPTVASNRPFVCTNESATLTAMGCDGGTYVWSNGSTGSTLTVSPTVDTQYRVRCKVGSCEGDWSPYTTVEVGAPAAPTISVAGQTGNATVCFGAPITLTAEGCPANSYVVWSNDQVGSSITVSLANGGTYTARCCTSNNCKSDPSNAITLTVLTKIPAPTTTDRTNTCPFNTADLTTAVGKPATTGGVFDYYTSTTLTAANRVTNPNAVGTGTYYVVERTVNGCTGLPGVIHVQINACTESVPCNTANPVTALAGADASICAAKTYRLNGSMGGSAASVRWTTSGTGTFDNPFSPTATYTASVGDVLAGRVTLKLTASASNTACGSAQDELVLTIDGAKTVPVVRIVGATQLCFGDSVRLEAPAGAGYLWSNRATTQSIMVRQGGTYSVQILDQNGCSSVQSADVVVRVAEPVGIPLASNLRNDCPAAIVNLTRALSATTAGSTYEYRIGELVSSSMLMRPDSVGAGTYYVFARNAAGCVSSPARVTVSIFNCAADSLSSDLSITKTANKQAVRQGETVLYTIKVRNNGNHTARNIDVRDVLPAGLEPVVGPTPGYTVSNGIVSRRIDSLPVGRTDSIVVAAIVRAKGAIVNTATITYADQRDPNGANNSASATVEDNTPYRSSQIGLAKAVVGQPTGAGDSIRATYRFTLTNFGDDTLRNVRLTDDLAYAFRPNVIRSVTVASTNPGSTLAFNPVFTGANGNVDLLDSASYLAPGRTQTFFLNVTVGRTAGDTTRTFHNIANVTAGNRTTAVADQSADGGDADPDGDGNPTNNAGLTTFTLGTQPTSGPSIGVALAVVKSEAQPDSSYNVMYQAIVKNFGDVPLMNVYLTDSLMRAFAAPVSYSVVGAPVVKAGSSLVINAGYNGNTDVNLLSDASKLAVGQQDTVWVTVNIRPNGSMGPFFTNAIATGMTTDSGQVVRDISNNGYDPKPEGAVSTPVRFNLPSALLGVAKSVGQPTRVDDGVYDIPYTIKVTNMGSVALKKVQVVDNLSQTFGRGALIVSNRIRVTADPGFVVDSTFTGQGLITNLLVDSLSTLPATGSRSLRFTVRVDVKNADTLTFLNSAMATALSTDGTVVSDQSTAGTNVDPDNDLDPRNNSTPTPIRLDSLTGNSHIGIAMAVRDTVRQANGSFNVTYQIVVKNYGKEVLTGVSISDTLSKVFNATTGASYTVIQAPVTTSTGSALKLNANFNGDSDARIVLGDSSSSLAVGKVDTILVRLNVMSTGSTTTFLSWAMAKANAKSGVVSDMSTNGLQPDLNGNGNPTDLNEREGTPLLLPLTNTALFIPQGFSPNGDGVNDQFVIRGLNGLTVGLEVFNRWGHCVYRTDNYQNDWDGKPNTGIVIGSDANGVPDGTYYYVIQTSDGRKFVRYMTINR